MIPKQTEAAILRLFHAEHWPIQTIANHFGVHHSVVRRILKVDQEGTGAALLRPTLADPFLPFMRETLEKYPRLRASRLHQMVRERGYTGAQSRFREIVASIRPRPAAEAYLRLHVLPGEQAQVDWGHFGKVTIGKAERKLYGFVMVLSWSRAIFLRFYLGSDNTANFLSGHVDAFAAFGGVPRVLLYDNLKSAVIERSGDTIRFNDTMLAFAGHYRYEPRPVAIARGNEKGRVERAIRYIRDSFFAARRWQDLDDLNTQAQSWCSGIAEDRKWREDPSRTVRDAFAEEQGHLLALPDNPYPTEDRIEVRVGKTPYVRFDLNDYSVPHDHVRRPLVVLATTATVRILDCNGVIAVHPRSFDKGAQIEDLSHVQALVAAKRAARTHRGLDRLHHAVPACDALIALAAKHGRNLGALTVGLNKLLDQYGAGALGAAVTEAVSAGTPHAAAVRQILERHRYEKGQPPSSPLVLPDDPRLRQPGIPPRGLEAYTALRSEVEA